MRPIPTLASNNIFEFNKLRMCPAGPKPTLAFNYSGLIHGHLRNEFYTLYRGQLYELVITCFSY